MRRSRLGLVVTVALVGALSACGGSSGGGATGGGAAPAATSSPAYTAAAKGVSGSPTPVGDDREHLVYVLKAVDSKMSTDDDALVTKSMTVCAAILGGKSQADIQKLTAKEFTNGSFTPEGAEVDAIDGTITAYFCR